MDDFNEYIKQGEPSKAERASTWQTAIGLQKVDNLEVSKYLVDTARKHIEGDINLPEVRRLVDSYYEKKGAKEDLSREKEADDVSVRILGLKVWIGVCFRGYTNLRASCAITISSKRNGH